MRGTARLAGPNTVVAETAEGDRTFEADAILLSTGSRPRVPEWAQVDDDRVMITRDAYPPAALPDHLVVIGSGVTGVEFVHMFSSLGCEVTLIVSRQQVLPQKDPEVAAVLEADFARRGVHLLKGARAVGVERTGGGGDRPVRRRALRPWLPRPALHRLDPQLRGAGPRDGRHRPRPRRLRRHQPPLPDAACRTSTPPATCPASCRCRRSPRCRAGRSPSTWSAGTRWPTGT